MAPSAQPMECPFPMTDKTPDTAEPKPVAVDPLETRPEMSSAIRAIKNATVDAVKVTMAVEIGRVTMSIKDLRAIRQGTVIPLDRSVGEPIDIRVNEVLIARGEVVSSEGHKYGIRVTEIIGTEEAEERS
ncbi:FliM/FliN family flagellar motor switch protein [Thioclava sp. BHET1]|nr:FliM/FliN family flagellar motor switch protein [Thioclava sp. BHET1]